jgi:spore coat polysaccharide biosynthesis protein SpsF
MARQVRVTIGIQARSTSRRFPRKVFETIAGRTILQHVLDSCRHAAQYLNNRTAVSGITAQLTLLVPYGDEIVSKFGNRVPVLEGPEDDVLSRYAALVKSQKPDYVVRVTADCPLIPHYLIMKHIQTAVQRDYDYLSNVDETARTAADGTDCEVMSAKLVEWLDQNAKAGPDREHVTPLARRYPPEWARIGHIIGHLNQSQLKLSVDTPEDLERVRAEYDRVQMALKNAEELHGRESIHRF